MIYENNHQTKNEDKNMKKKKKHFGWLIALIIIVVLVVAPIASIYIFIFDGASPKEVTPQEPEILLKQKMVKALKEDRATPSKLNILLEDNDINSLLAKAKNSLPKEVANNVKGFDSSCDGKNMNFYLYIGDLPLNFKTKVTLETSLSETDEAYIWNINDIKLGKISGNFVLDKVKDLITDDSINSAFKDNGLNIQSDLTNKRLVYTKENTNKDIINLLGTEDKDGLYSAIIKEMVDLKLFAFGVNNGISAEIDLSPISTSEYYQTSKAINYGSKNATETISEYRNTVISLMNSNESFKSSAPYDTYLMNYLLKGYENSNDETKQYVDTLDFSSLSSPTIVDTKLYEGIYKDKIGSETTIDKLITDKIPSALISKKIQISENELDILFRNTSFLGTSFLLSAPFEEGIKSSFIVVDNFYSDITSDKIAFTAITNVGGQEVPFTLDFKKFASENNLLTLNKDRILIGDKEANEETCKALFKLLSEALKKESWINVDVAKESISIALSVDSLGSKTEISLEGNSVSEEGKLTLTVSA